MAAVAGVFLAERRVVVDGVAPTLWDPIAGDYLARDGWVRLHTNYPAHRAATLRALALSSGANRRSVSAAVAERSALAVEETVVAAGGAAAALRTKRDWRAHPQSSAVARRALIEVVTQSPRSSHGWEAGISSRLPRVLDLTRGIAGPTATKVLAAIGADVLRVDPPGVEEVPALVADTSAGKRYARLDLRDSRVEVLIAAAELAAEPRLGCPPRRSTMRAAGCWRPASCMRCDFADRTGGVGASASCWPGRASG